MPPWLPHVDPQLLPQILHLVLASSDEKASEESFAAKRPYEVKEIAGKGKGCIATHSIKRGSVILNERPLLVWRQQLSPDEAEDLASTLDGDVLEILADLSDSAKEYEPDLHPILAIRATNAFNVELPPLPASLKTPTHLKQLATHASMLFPDVARLNHSCLPNADHCINWSDLSMTVYATSDISPGDEILIEYTSALIQADRARRQERLRTMFYFQCRCDACALDDIAGQASDTRREEIDRCIKSIDEDPRDRPKVLEMLGRVQELIKAEGYRAMPEFDSPAVSTAFTMYATRFGKS
ncbi:uncharacterized protein L969DRAFT_93322 [Mixia osmundae IAM 14324]|uniref:SET domain-containing protein n=1 Tax=Mixia osmundae (strain CBS 9802 / IAM 14324 / JCM 22182 / KY 12970) TaxID=764103 RepID=G7E5E9_MIXOS|nr:uncharacterized protein L969DRAFT_93322 [Mixia osmundae IAM 14324]KEI40790.1 hypothetical protein L969DRAFT_93322 [Mixia osmundae IAM 14324]GAA98059.1 hypothetical protein E5Q_04740 [Mixia osmundae IAM 14324]